MLVTTGAPYMTWKFYKLKVLVKIWFCCVWLRYAFHLTCVSTSYSLPTISIVIFTNIKHPTSLMPGEWQRKKGEEQCFWVCFIFTQKCIFFFKKSLHGLIFQAHFSALNQISRNLVAIQSSLFFADSHFSLPSRAAHIVWSTQLDV